MAISHRLGVLLVVAALALTACGHSDSDAASANAAACAAKDDLAASVQTVVNDLKAGNLGDARSHLPEVQTRASDLKSAISDLSRSEQQQLDPLTTKLDTAIDNLKSATNLRDLRTALAEVTIDLANLLDQLRSDLQCSSSAPS